MRTIVVGDEKNLAALRKRILDPGVTGSARKGIDEELRAANPHLDLDKLSPGAVVVVPDVPGLSAPPADDQTTTALPVNFAAATTIDLGAARKELAKQLGSSQLTKAAKGDDLLRAEVARLNTAIAEEQQRAQQWQDALTAAVPAWRAALDALRGDG
jgi:hypothetical protein